MKKLQLLVLVLPILSSFSYAQNSEERQLWLITARISYDQTYQRDTTGSFDAGGKNWTREFHQSARTSASGTISAIVENQAANPAKDFLYHSDAGEPVSFTVTGNGSSSESSNSLETIDWKTISADERTDNVSGSARPGGSLYFEYSDDSKSLSADMGINAVGSYKGRRFDGEWHDYGSEIKDYSLSCSGSGDALNDKNCRITKTGTGYQGNWKKSESRQHHTASGPEFITSVTTIEITIIPYKESDKPCVTLIGCTELGVGENSMVVATGKPEGGTFRFWAEPSSMLTIETDGSSANITGASPGKGTLFMEYTTPEGKTAQSSQAASTVKVEKYNGGQPIPQIALYDIEGKKLPGIKTIPVDAQPASASELLKFVPADPGILSALGVGGVVTLQGLRLGKTTLQAKTNCGQNTGPSVEVEVVNCDEETIETLKRMREVATENLREANENLQRVANSEEFEKARDEIVESTIELLAKSALTIMGSGHAHGAVETAIEVAEAGESVSEMVAAAGSEQFSEKTIEATLKAVGNQAMKAFVGAMGVHEAAQKFGENVGQILYHEDVLKGVMDNFEQAYRNLQNIIQRQQFCSGEKTEPQKTEPSTEPTKPAKPTPKTDTPPSKDPVTTSGTPPTQEPAPGEPPVSPPPPTSEPRQVGLPYSAAECGCNTSKGLRANAADFTTLGSGIKNLGGCVESFSSTSLNSYQQSLQELSAFTDSLSGAISTKPSEFKLKAKDSKSRIDAIVKRVKAYDVAGRAFLNTMGKCPQTVSTGMEIFKSVENITVDSITTNY